MQTGPHAQLPTPVQKQAIGGRQQHFEKDEQVEQVARQEGTVQPHQKELEHAVEMLPLPVPAGRRIKQRRQGQKPGQHQHHRRQTVNNQHDAVRRGPVAQKVEADVVVARQFAAL